MKPTRFISNSPWMLRRLARRCGQGGVGHPEHLRLAGQGEACRQAAAYPNNVILEMMRVIRDMENATDMGAALQTDRWKMVAEAAAPEMLEDLAVDVHSEFVGVFAQRDSSSPEIKIAVDNRTSSSSKNVPPTCGLMNISRKGTLMR